MDSPSVHSSNGLVEPRARLGARMAPIWLLALALAGGLSSVAFGEAEGDAPKVHLDQLLELPSGREYTVDKRGGRTQKEWRNLFAEVEKGLKEAEKALEEAEEELAVVADSSEPWTVGPSLPGVTNADAPLDYQLRQEIRRQRSEIERLEGRRNELAVEADLASVPIEWRE